jgi:hypothetical protein
MTKKIVQGIVVDIGKRWEDGTDHHPEAEQIIRDMDRIDWAFNNGSTDIRTGGDGDYGEQLLYLLSIVLEARDKGLTVDDLIKDKNAE